MAKAKITITLLERAIAGEPEALLEVVRILKPILKVRIARILWAGGDRSCREIPDLCQDTLFALLRDGGRLARMWDPARGMSFENYAGLIATQRAIEYLRRIRESLFPTSESREEFEPAVDSSRTPERLYASAEMRRVVFDIVRAEQSEVGQKVMVLLYEECRDVHEISTMMGMSAPAVYAWRSRLGRRIGEVAAMLEGAV